MKLLTLVLLIPIQAFCQSELKPTKKINNYKKEAPIIYQGYCEYIPPPPSPSNPNSQLKSIGIVNDKKGIIYDGKICIDIKEFYGSSPYNIPFVAVIHGQIKELWVNNKRISFDGPGEIFFRQNMSLENGYNRIPVKVVGINGRSRTGFIEITITER